MTTTVTTVTVSTVTVMGLTAALGVIVTLTLIGLLVAKELASATPGERGVHWGRVLNIGVVPLLLSFLVIVGVKLADAL